MTLLAPAKLKSTAPRPTLIDLMFGADPAALQLIGHRRVDARHRADGGTVMIRFETEQTIARSAQEVWAIKVAEGKVHYELPS